MKHSSFRLLGSLIFLCAISSQSAEASPINIGVSVPLTGPAQAVGKDVKNVLEFANTKLAQGRYQLIFEDDKCSPKEAVSIAQKFVNIDKVKYVLGLPCSGTVLAAAPIFERGAVVTISALASASAVSQAGSYIFRTRPDDRAGAELLMRHIARKHRSLLILTEQTDYADLLAEEMKSKNEVLNLGVLITKENFLSDTSDFASLVTRIKKLAPQALMISVQTEGTFAHVLRQVKQLGLTMPVYGSMIPEGQNFRKLAGADAEGIEFVTLPQTKEVASVQGQRMYDDFIKQYGPLTVDNIFLTTWDSFAALHEAMTSGNNVKQSLETRTFEGSTGQFSFDANGDVSGLRHVIKTIRDGQVQQLAVVE